MVGANATNAYYPEFRMPRALDINVSVACLRVVLKSSPRLHPDSKAAAAAAPPSNFELVRNFLALLSALPPPPNEP